MPPKNKKPKYCSHACYSTAKRNRSLAERIEPYLDKSGDCWIWTGSRSPANYGRMYFQGQFVLVHRVMYAASTGEDITGKVIRHYVCDNPPCCNPAHLRSGTAQDNTNDAISKSRHAHGETSYAKLTEEQVKMIRRDPRSPVELARELGVNRTTIRHVRNRDTWKHID